MNLSDYINLTLVEIAKGAQQADKTYKEMGDGGIITATNMVINGIPHLKKIGVSEKHCTYKPIINVEFKVQVELEETEEVKGDIAGSIRVVSANKEERGSIISRTSHEISFSIPMTYPSEKKQTDTTSPSSQC